MKEAEYKSEFKLTRELKRHPIYQSSLRASYRVSFVGTLERTYTIYIYIHVLNHLAQNEIVPNWLFIGPLVTASDSSSNGCEAYDTNNFGKYSFLLYICYIFWSSQHYGWSLWIDRSLHPTEIYGCNHFDALVQDCSISSALAMEILQSCTKPSTYPCFDITFIMLKSLFCNNVPWRCPFYFQKIIHDNETSHILKLCSYLKHGIFKF